MSESILDKQICLKLNSSWQAIGFLTVRDSVTFLCSEQSGKHPGYVMDYETGVNAETGEPELLYSQPVAWEQWIQLPVRPTDLAINTGRGQIRAPLVVICANYSKVPMRTLRWSNGNVHKRDKMRCGYTGRLLTHSTATVDHIQPRSRGGRDEWTNTVSCHKEVNLMKADRTPEEAGLRLLVKPKAPPTMPVIYTAEDARHPAQKPFLL